MILKRKITTFIFILGIALIPVWAGGDKDQKFSKADTDQNSVIGEEEYRNCLASNSFSLWDTDGDAYLSPDEFYQAQFNILDEDANGTIEGEEWEKLNTYQFLSDDSVRAHTNGMKVYGKEKAECCKEKKKHGKMHSSTVYSEKDTAEGSTYSALMTYDEDTAIGIVYNQDDDFTAYEDTAPAFVAQVDTRQQYSMKADSGQEFVTFQDTIEVYPYFTDTTNIYSSYSDTTEGYFRHKEMADRCRNWDTNDDQKLSYNEFEKMMDAQNYYSPWDADNNGMLTETEMLNATFSLFDINNNGYIEQGEFNKYDGSVCEPELSLK